MLARCLEREQPGAHAEEIMRAVADALRSAGDPSSGAPPDVAPLFDLLRTYRADDAVALLERSAGDWSEYAVIALADLPDGAGIPSVTALALTADAGDRSFAFRVLAQATAENQEARDELVALAHAGEIPDDVWPAMAEALAGRRLRLARGMFDGTPLGDRGVGGPQPRRTYYVQWLNVRYEEDVVSTDWSDDGVDRQLAVIDGLREATSSPAAVQALQRARESLQRRRGDADPPIPGG
jgi:hypothetical protein